MWDNAVHGAHAPNVPGRGSPGTGAYSRPINRHPLSFLQPQPTGTPSQRPISETRKSQGEHEHEAIYLQIPAQLLAAFTSRHPRFRTSPRRSGLRSRELPHGKTPSACCRQAFTSTIARGLSLVAIVVAGLTFAFGEGGSKRVLAGVLFGVGMAIAAVNFLSWLFPGN